MIIVDYPPGGLGNFAAQVITDTVINTGQPSFHNNHSRESRAYDIQLVCRSQQEFLHRLAEWQPTHSVAICHSHGAVAELKRYTNYRIISIRPVKRWLQLYLNKQLKAMPQATMPAAQSYDWHYRAIESMKTQESYSIDHELLNFDHFYSGPEQFRHTIQQLNPLADSDGLYHLFNQTQQPILDQIAQLEQLAESGRAIQHRTNLEQALIAWIRQDR